MIVLGIHDGHCSSACVMVDGALKALAAEERFTRLKNDHGYPYSAIEYCLRELGLSPGDIDTVAYASTNLNIFGVKLKALSLFSSDDWVMLEKEYWKPLLHDGVDDKRPFYKLYTDERFVNNGHFYDFSGISPEAALESKSELGRKIRLEALNRHLGISADRVRYYDHHTCHAAYALFGSPIREDNTMIYTLDGGGDGATSTLFRFADGHIQELARSNRVDTARIYRYITLMLGMKLGEHEYKVMGLAPYAPEREFNKSWDVFKGAFHVQDDLIAWRNGRRPKDLYFAFKEAFENHRFDGIAAATQHMAETSVTDWIYSTSAKYGSRNAVFAGGVAMNVKLNMLLAESEKLDDFYVPPSPSDDTLCIGACYICEAETEPGAWERLAPITDVYIGPSFTREDVLKAIKQTRVAEKCRVEENITAQRIADILLEGKVVARLGGKMELGQRALGNRSILADPSKEYMVDRINHQIKYRDFWMPFAPVILKERVRDYLQFENSEIDRSYMMFGAETTELGEKKLTAAIHNGDKSARPQVLSREQNGGYYDIIKAFENLTGIGALLNTSFNLHGEPIVCSPLDAISTFERSEFDVLVMEDIALMR